MFYHSYFDSGDYMTMTADATRTNGYNGAPTATVINTEHDYSTNENEVYVGGFTSEDESKIILQVFNEGEEKDFSMDIPIGAISVERILTTNNDSEEFTSLGTQEINYYDRYFLTTLPELSLTSFVSFSAELLATKEEKLHYPQQIKTGYEIAKEILIHPTQIVHQALCLFLEI